MANRIREPGRDLTIAECGDYEILVMQLEDDRPMRTMCPWADRFMRTFKAYTTMKKRVKVLENLRRKGN
jgi:hypothetical protein